jgi:hypothetical protein
MESPPGESIVMFSTEILMASTPEKASNIQYSEFYLRIISLLIISHHEKTETSCSPLTAFPYLINLR